MKSKKELYILLLVFVLPIILGTLFFYFNSSYFTKNTVNYGTLINPVITTKKSDIIINSSDDINRLWSLAYYSGNSCDDSCDDILELMITTRTLMNDQMRRIQIISLGINNNNKVKSSVISQDLQQKLSNYDKNTIFVIDPIGNIMLYYDGKNLEIKKVIKDLKRLFKYSRIG